MVRTGALAHTIWSGSSILYRLALGLRTAVPGPKSTLLTACFRLALWTGQCQVVPRALSPFYDMTLHRVNVMTVHNLGVCKPQACQLHTKSKIPNT